MNEKRPEKKPAQSVARSRRPPPPQPRSVHTSRTKRTHKPREPRPVKVVQAPDPMMVIPVPVQNADDPPQEHALVLYDGDENPNARDPTMYIERDVNPDQCEPEGDKISKKTSMFASAALMSEARREGERERRKRSSRKRRDVGSRRLSFTGWKRTSSTEPEENGNYDLPQIGYGESDNRMSEPEGVTSDEIARDSRRKSRKKKESPSNRVTRRNSGYGDRIKSSLTAWRKQDMPIDIDLESHGSADSPSILTNHVHADDRHNGGGNRYARDEEAGHARSHAPSKSSKKKKKKSAGGDRCTSRANTGGVWASIRRLSSNYDRDGVNSVSDDV